MVRKLLPKGDSWIGRASSWWGVFGPGGAFWVIIAALSAAMSWLVRQVEPIAQVGWGAVVLAGILLACLIMLSVGVGMLGWRQFRPQTDKQIRGSPLEGASRDGAEGDNLQTQIAALKGNLETLARSNIAVSNSQSERLDLMNSQISGLSDRLSKFDSILRPREKGLLAQAFLMDTDGTRLGAIESRLEVLSADLNKALETIEVRLDEQKRNHHLLHDKVWDTLHAKQVLERIVALVGKLDELGATLSAPISNKQEAIDWTGWHEKFKAWEVSLHELCIAIKPYHDIEESLLETPAERYKSQYWQTAFDPVRFPTPDHVHDFKTFRLLYRNLEDHKTKILEAVRHRAFV
jgi:hypothetical protein